MDRALKVVEIIKKLRQLNPHPKIALNYSTPWELFVSVVLSAQTTDKKVNEVTPQLFKKFPKVENYAGLSEEELGAHIKQIGLFRMKARNIIASAKIISEKHDGKIPDNMEELVALPGVGRKTANILLSDIYDKQLGIAVDTHVKRLSNLFGLSKESDPEKIEKDLMNIVPKESGRILAIFL